MNRSSSNNNDKRNVTSKKLYVKYMVSLRCKVIAKSEIEKLGLICKFSPHGALEFCDGISESQYDQLKKGLLKSCMVLLDETESLLIDKIINTVVEIIHYSNTLPKVNFMDLINRHSVSGEEPILKIFSDVKGMSILQFIVNQKIERAKELLLYEDVPLTEIAELLSYENKYYLIAQFKKVTGLSPTYFKKLKKERMAIAQKAVDADLKAPILLQ